MDFWQEMLHEFKCGDLLRGKGLLRRVLVCAQVRMQEKLRIEVIGSIRQRLMVGGQPSGQASVCNWKALHSQCYPGAAERENLPVMGFLSVLLVPSGLSEELSSLIQRPKYLENALTCYTNSLALVANAPHFHFLGLSFLS